MPDYPFSGKGWRMPAALCGALAFGVPAVLRLEVRRSGRGRLPVGRNTPCRLSARRRGGFGAGQAARRVWSGQAGEAVPERSAVRTAWARLSVAYRERAVEPCGTPMR